MLSKRMLVVFTAIFFLYSNIQVEFLNNFIFNTANQELLEINSFQFGFNFEDRTGFKSELAE